MKSMKALKSPFKLILVLLFFLNNKKKYISFRQIANGKHFYEWQWTLLDKIYRVQKGGEVSGKNKTNSKIPY